MVFLLLNMTKHKSNPCESNAQASDCFQCRVADSIFFYVCSVCCRACGRQGVDPECRTQHTDVKLQITKLLLVIKKQKPERPERVSENVTALMQICDVLINRADIRSLHRNILA